jgi:broad specificity phosphatase PhoE
MKWPLSITLIRHGQSTYNELRQRKLSDPLYQKFIEEYGRGDSANLVALAQKLRIKFALNVSDYDTPLSEIGHWQARQTGLLLSKNGAAVPDVILVSPYVRTRETLEELMWAWPALVQSKIDYDDRIREQEHGESLLYNDWRIFHALNPKQREFRELMGPYWYQYPQGESVSMVRDRIRSITDTLIREYAGMHVMMVTHHLTILSIRANFERLSPEEFVRLDKEEKPVNCGVTFYWGDPSIGSDGRLVLEYYNRKLY